MLRPRRVLLVEDDDSSRVSLRLVLEAFGHAVEEAHDGLDGLRKAAEWKPDAAIVDIDMRLFGSLWPAE